MGDEIPPTGNFNKGDYQHSPKWRYARIELIPARLFNPELIEVININKWVYALMRESVVNMSYENLIDKPHILQDHMAHQSIELLDLINQAAKDGWELTDNFPISEHLQLNHNNRGHRFLLPMMRQRVIMDTDDFQKGEGQQYPKWRYATVEQITTKSHLGRDGTGIHALFLKKYTNFDYYATEHNRKFHPFATQRVMEMNKNITHRSNNLLNLINQAAKDGWELTDNFPLKERQRVGGQNCTVTVPMMRQRIN